MEPLTPASPPPPVTESAPIVTDHRTAPRGVLPRGVQTWLLAGLAAFMLLIMFVIGKPQAPARVTPTPTQPAVPSADRVRDYQGRLRALETQSITQAGDQPTAGPTDPRVYDDPAPPRAPDPVEADRRRREYESLFASNVVLSRRPESQRPDAGGSRFGAQNGASLAESPTVDEIADAALRATSRASGLSRGEPTTIGPVGATTPGGASTTFERPRSPERMSPIGATGPMHRILEGTLVDAVLTNRLDGTTAAPVNCLVTNPVYSHAGQHILIPAGARVLGETKPVQSLGETRLAVAFHRLLMPDGRTYRLDQFLGLNQVGDAGLKDQVNQHYLATFGAAGAVGLISGLSQLLSSASLGRGDGNDRTVLVTGGMADTTSQATLQVMNKFLNRLPTVTIREGHRLKIYLTGDLELPAYAAATQF